MKKQLLLLYYTVFCIGFVQAQCIPTCSSYAVSAIDYTTFPSGTTNVTPTFTNSFLGTWADDGSIGPIPIGFNFDYYCNTYTNIHICSNGFIMMDYQAFPWPTQYVHPTQNLPSSSLPDGIIAFNMTDMDPGVGGTITYTTVGIAPNRMFIVTFSNVPCFTTQSDLNTGQIVLYETSNLIEIHTTSAFHDSNQGTLGSTQGIENTTGSIGVTPPGRNANNTWGGNNAANTAYRFSPYTPAPPTTVTGSSLACQGTSNFYQATFMIGATAYGWSLPGGWTGTSTISAITATAGVSGNLSVTATYSCGTSAPTTISVNVVPAPVVSLQTPTPNILCSGVTVTFNASGATSYTLDPAGAIGTPPFTDIPAISTTYTLTGSDINGCVSINTATTFVTVKETPTITVSSGTVCHGQTFTINASGAPSYVYSSVFPTIPGTTPPGMYTYTVTGTGTNQCVSQPAISSLTIYALPNVGATASRSVMCTKESVTISGTGATTYSWSNHSTANTITVSPTTNTFYVVTGTNLDGCKNTGTINIQVKLCSGLEELGQGDLHIGIYPNPNNGEFSVHCDLVNEKLRLEVFNALGELILVEPMTSENAKIDLSAHSNGLYYIKITAGSAQETIKVIKK